MWIAADLCRCASKTGVLGAGHATEDDSCECRGLYVRFLKCATALLLQLGAAMMGRDNMQKTATECDHEGVHYVWRPPKVRHSQKTLDMTREVPRGRQHASHVVANKAGVPYGGHSSRTVRRSHAVQAQIGALR